MNYILDPLRIIILFYMQAYKIKLEASLLDFYYIRYEYSGSLKDHYLFIRTRSYK